MSTFDLYLYHADFEDLELRVLSSFQENDMKIDDMTILLSTIREMVPHGGEVPLSSLAKRLGVPQETLIGILDEMNDMTLNVGVRAGSGALRLPKSDWTVEKIR